MAAVLPMQLLVSFHLLVVLFHLDHQTSAQPYKISDITGWSPYGIVVDGGTPPLVYITNYFSGQLVRLDQSDSGQPQRGGSVLVAGMTYPLNVALCGAARDLLVADSGNNRLLKFTKDGAPLEVIAPRYSHPSGVICSGDGTTYVTDATNRAFHVDETGTVLFTFPDLSNAHGVTLGYDNTVYIANTYNSSVLQFSVVGELLQSWQDTQPFGVTVDASHNVYVSSPNEGHVVIFPRGGDRRTISTGLVTPFSTALDTAQNLYVADRDGSQVVKFAPNGSLLNTWLRPLSQPSGLAVDNTGTVIVASPGSKCAAVYAANNTFMQLLPMQLQALSGVAIASDGTVWVVETALNQVIKFHSDWTVEASLTFGLSGPTGIAVDSLRIFVTDTGNQRIVQFDADNTPSVFSGQLALTIPVACAIDPQGPFIYIVDAGEYRIVKADMSGILLQYLSTSSPRLHSPAGIALDLNSRVLYLADSGNNRVVVFNMDSADGGVASVFTGIDPPLLSPTGVAVHPISYVVYVADTGNDRIVLFSPYSNLINTVWFLLAFLITSGVGLHRSFRHSACNWKRYVYQRVHSKAEKCGRLCCHHRADRFHSNGVTVGGGCSYQSSGSLQGERHSRCGVLVFVPYRLLRHPDLPFASR